MLSILLYSPDSTKDSKNQQVVRLHIIWNSNIDCGSQRTANLHVCLSVSHFLETALPEETKPSFLESNCDEKNELFNSSDGV